MASQIIKDFMFCSLQINNAPRYCSLRFTMFSFLEANKLPTFLFQQISVLAPSGVPISHILISCSGQMTNVLISCSRQITNVLISLRLTDYQCSHFFVVTDNISVILCSRQITFPDVNSLPKLLFLVSTDYQHSRLVCIMLPMFSCLQSTDYLYFHFQKSPDYKSSYFLYRPIISLLVPCNHHTTNVLISRSRQSINVLISYRPQMQDAQLVKQIN